jgi:hypothetical protein
MATPQTDISSPSPAAMPPQPIPGRLPQGVEIRGPQVAGQDQTLSSSALSFVAMLERRFGPRRRSLLKRRKEVQAKLDSGWLPELPGDASEVRRAEWRVAPIPGDLQDRRVEITGPVDRKMVINALNSGASVFMADFEDSCSPTWKNLLEGQQNLTDAIERSIEFVSPEGKEYRLRDETATLMVRPRGWHLEEKHLTVDGEPVSRASSISASSSSTTRGGSRRAGRARTSTSPRWRATSRRASGPTSSAPPRSTSTSRTAAFARPS